MNKVHIKYILNKQAIFPIMNYIVNGGKDYTKLAPCKFEYEKKD